MHEIGTVRTLWYCESCNTTEIPWRPHCAWFDHTRYSPAGARMDASRVAPCPTRLRADAACPAVVRRWADTDRDCHLSVLLADERVPHCDRVPYAFARRPVRPAAPPGGRVDAVGAPQPPGL